MMTAIGFQRVAAAFHDATIRAGSAEVCSVAASEVMVRAIPA